MRIRALLAVGAVLGLMLTAGSANAVTGGTPDGENHPYVAFIHNGQFACTGAAISDRLVVTAAHCFDFPTDDVFVTFETNRRRPGAVFHTGTWHADPQFCIGCAPGLPGFDTHDVAVIVLDNPAPRPRYAVLPSLGLVDGLPNGTNVDLVGYGVQDFLVGGGPPTPARTSGLRMFAPANLKPSNHSISDEFIKLSANHSQGNGGVCFGDSGGPDLLAGTDVMLAINSFGTNGGCNGLSYSFRIDTADALGFIAQFG